MNSRWVVPIASSDSTCLTTNKTDRLAQRIHHIGARIREFIEVFEPNIIGIESLFLANNQKTAMAVSEVKGVVGFLATDAKIPIYEFTPLQIKIAITGDGKAPKGTVDIMIPIYEFTPLQIKIAITGDGKAPKGTVDIMIPKLVQYDMIAKLAEYGGKSSGIDDELDAIAVGITTLASIKEISLLGQLRQ